MMRFVRGVCVYVTILNVKGLWLMCVSGGGGGGDRWVGVFVAMIWKENSKLLFINI